MSKVNHEEAGDSSRIERQVEAADATKRPFTPWRVEPDPVHGASIRDAKGNQIVAHIYDEENAAIITDRDRGTKCGAIAVAEGSFFLKYCHEHRGDRELIDAGVNIVAALSLARGEK